MTDTFPRAVEENQSIVWYNEGSANILVEYDASRAFERAYGCREDVNVIAWSARWRAVGKMRGTYLFLSSPLLFAVEATFSSEI